MQQGPLVTELVRGFIGTESRPTTMVVEKGHIRRFAEAMQDPNPLWQDEVKARDTRYGGIVAPSTFLRTMHLERPEVELNLPLTRLLDGGSEWEFFQPVRPGDTITGVVRLADVQEKMGRVGRMVLVTHEATYTNQFGQVVVKQRTTRVRY